MSHYKKFSAMRHYILLILVIVLGIGLQGCSLFKNDQVATEGTPVSILQNGNEMVIDGQKEEVTIDKAPFKLHFYTKKYNSDNNSFYAGRLVAFRDKSVLDDIKQGKKRREMPCFEPGTGMAASESGRYTSLIFEPNAHHYLLYENEDHRRVNLLEKKDGQLKVEFPVSRVMLKDQDVEKSMKDISMDKFYMALFIDRNLNDVIDEGELKKITVNVAP